MDDPNSISDPTDFATSKLPSLSRVDALLRCQICKDFFTNAVITSCCHTFCSLCIRRSLSSEGKCPTCRTTELESKLRRNVAIQELVDAYAQARPDILKCAQDTPPLASPILSDPKSSSKRKRADSDELSSNQSPARFPRTRGQRRSARTSSSASTAYDTSTAPAQSSSRTADRVDEHLPDALPQEEQAGSDELVPCPICNSLMKPEAVFDHVGICNGGEKTPQNDKLEPSLVNGAPIIHEKLPQLNYSLFKEHNLRKKLSDLGIPSSGPKQLLIRRHTEWINLWNANCDSARPISRKQLLAELENWEKTQGGRAKTLDSSGINSVLGSASGGAGSVMRKDFDGAAWAKQNKGSFDALITSARKMASARKANIPSSNEGDCVETQSQISQLPLSTTPTLENESSQLDNDPSTRQSEDTSTIASDQSNRRLPRSIDTGRRFSSPVPGFSPKVSRENTRDTPSSPVLQSPATPPAPVPAPTSMGRRVIRRGSLGVTPPASLHAETSLPDRIFKKVTFGDIEESRADSPILLDSGMKRKPMFEVPTEPVVDADMNDSNK